MDTFLNGDREKKSASTRVNERITAAPVILDPICLSL